MSEAADTVTTKLIARVKHGAEEEWTMGGSVTSSAGTLNTEKTLASYVKVTDGVRKVQMKSSFTESGFRPQVFSFNRCFSQETSQADFFGGCGAINSLDRLLRSSNLGSDDSQQVNFCILAYGQTGAGKTHTMFGAGPLTGPPTNHSHIDAAVEETYETEIQEKDPHSQPEDGLIVRSIEYLFLQLLHTSSVVHNFHLKLSCVEIYDDVVNDLFSGSNLPVHIKENISEGFSVSHCQFIDCTSFESAAAAIELVARHRRGRYAPNSLHSPLRDSDIHHGVHKVDRSHCIVEVCICVPMQVGEGAFSEYNSGLATPTTEHAETHRNQNYARDGPASPRYITRAKVTFVDLAGSERLRSEPKLDLKSTTENSRSSGKSASETKTINPSLYVLGKVIAGLIRAKGDIHADDVPYHDSVLTKLLIEPLSRGNMLRSNILIACIDDSPRCEYETLRTLKFATSCVQLRSKAVIPVPKMSKQDKLINELKLSIKKVKEDNQEMRRTILATPSWGDKILAHCDEDTLEASAAFANAPAKLKPKIKDVKKPVSLSEKKRTWASWKLFENNSKAKTAVINAHQTHLPISNLLTSGSRVYPMAGPTLNGQFPSQYMSQTSQSTTRGGGSTLRSTTAPHGSTVADDEDFRNGFYDDQEREEMLLKKLADGMNANKPRPSSSPNEKTSFPSGSLFGSVTMSGVSGMSALDSQANHDSQFSRTGPIPRGKSAQKRENANFSSGGEGQSAKYENHMAEKRMAARMKKRVLDECKKKNHQPISPYLGHFVPKRVIHDRPTFEVPLLHDIVPLHASIHQDEPEHERDVHKTMKTSGELREGSHSRSHTPNKTRSDSKSRSPSRSPSKSRPGSTHKKRGGSVHNTPGSAERGRSRGTSGKIRSPEVLALEKAIQPHSIMFGLLDAEYKVYRLNDDDLHTNPSSLVERILPTGTSAAEDHSFSPRTEPLDLSVDGKGLSPQQKMSLKEDIPPAEVQEEGEYDSYDEQFEAEEESVKAPAYVEPSVSVSSIEKKEEVVERDAESTVDPPSVVTWSPSTKNVDSARSISPSVESEVTKSPSASLYPLPTTAILASAQHLTINAKLEPPTPGFLSPNGRSQKANYAPQPAAPALSSPVQEHRGWENEAVLLMAPVFAANEARHVEERQESFTQRMTMSSKGGFSSEPPATKVASHEETYEEENYEDEFDADEGPAKASPAPVDDDTVEKEEANSTMAVEPNKTESEPVNVEVETAPIAPATPHIEPEEAATGPVVDPMPTQDSYEDYDYEFEDDEGNVSKKEQEPAVEPVTVAEAPSEDVVAAEEPVEPVSGPDEQSTEVVQTIAPAEGLTVEIAPTDTASAEEAESPLPAQADSADAPSSTDLAHTEIAQEDNLNTTQEVAPVASSEPVPTKEEETGEYEMEFNDDKEVAEQVPVTEPVVEVKTPPEPATQPETEPEPATQPEPVEPNEASIVSAAADAETPADVETTTMQVDSEEVNSSLLESVSADKETPVVVDAEQVTEPADKDKTEEEAYEEEFERDEEEEIEQAVVEPVFADPAAETAANESELMAAPVSNLGEESTAETPAPEPSPEEIVLVATVDSAEPEATAVESENDLINEQTAQEETSNIETAIVPASPAKTVLTPPPANFEAFTSEISSGAVSRAVTRLSAAEEASTLSAEQDVLVAETLAADAVGDVLSRFTPREPEPSAVPEVIDVLDLPLSPVHMLGDIDPVHHISATTMSEPFHLLDDFSEYDISWEMSPSPDPKGHGIAESEAESAKLVGVPSERIVSEAQAAELYGEPVAMVGTEPEIAVTESEKETEEPAVEPPVVDDLQSLVATDLIETPVFEFEEGARVVCNYHASGDWYAGVIASTNVTGTYNIAYDDGDKETDVPAVLIRAEVVEAPAEPPTHGARLSVGDKVEANYRGKGRWYSGVISRVRESGTYDIDYDDGEKEIHVEADLVRLLDVAKEDPEVTAFVEELVAEKESASTSVVADPTPDVISALPSILEIDNPSPLYAGARVEGNYHGSGVWYPGVLARVHPDGSADINYDDGDVEANVPASLIRIEKEAVAPAPSVPLYSVGARVEGNYRGKRRWYSGTICRVRESGTYDIDYDDGEKETHVDADLIRLMVPTAEEDPDVTALVEEILTAPAAASLQAGQRVEGNYRGSGVWYPGVLARVHPDGSADIHYDDGEVEAYVPASLIRIEASSSVSLDAEQAVQLFPVGTKVEANYRGKGRWYSGVVSRVRESGTYDVDYDDGEKEIHVEADLVRALEIVAEPAVVVEEQMATFNYLQVRARVEGNYRGSGVWYPGVLARVHPDGSADINYDDGEVEAYVPASLIRVEKEAVSDAAIVESEEPDSLDVQSNEPDTSLMLDAEAAVEVPVEPIMEVSEVEAEAPGPEEKQINEVARQEEETASSDTAALIDSLLEEASAPVVRAASIAEVQEEPEPAVTVELESSMPISVAAADESGVSDTNAADIQETDGVSDSVFVEEIQTTNATEAGDSTEQTVVPPPEIEIVESAPAEIDSSPVEAAIERAESVVEAATTEEFVIESAVAQESSTDESNPVVAAEEPAVETDAMEAESQSAVELVGTEEAVTANEEAPSSVETESDHVGAETQVANSVAVKDSGEILVVDEPLSAEPASVAERELPVEPENRSEIAIEPALAESDPLTTEPVGPATIENFDEDAAPQDIVVDETSAVEVGTTGALSDDANTTEIIASTNEEIAQPLQDAADVTVVLEEPIDVEPASQENMAANNDANDPVATSEDQITTSADETEAADVSHTDEPASLPEKDGSQVQEAAAQDVPESQAVIEAEVEQMAETLPTEVADEAVTTTLNEEVVVSESVEEPEVTAAPVNEPSSESSSKPSSESMDARVDEPTVSEMDAVKTVPIQEDTLAVVAVISEEANVAHDAKVADVTDVVSIEEGVPAPESQPQLLESNLEPEVGSIVVADGGNATDVAEVAQLEGGTATAIVEHEIQLEAIESQLVAEVVAEPDTSTAEIIPENQNDPVAVPKPDKEVVETDGAVEQAQTSDELMEVLADAEAVESVEGTEEQHAVEVESNVASDEADESVAQIDVNQDSVIESNLLESNLEPEVGSIVDADSGNGTDVAEVVQLEGGAATVAVEPEIQPEIIESQSMTEVADVEISTAEITSENQNDPVAVPEPDQEVVETDVAVEQAQTSDELVEVDADAEAIGSVEETEEQPAGEVESNVASDSAVINTTDEILAENDANQDNVIESTVLAPESVSEDTTPVVTDVAAPPINEPVVEENIIDDSAAQVIPTEETLAEEALLPVAEVVVPEPAAPRVIEKGSRIEGNYRCKGTWISGEVMRLHKDGSADIRYDNGEMEAYVPPSWMRLAEEEVVQEETPVTKEPESVEEPPVSDDAKDVIEVAPEVPSDSVAAADPSEEEEVLEVFSVPAESQPVESETIEECTSNRAESREVVAESVENAAAPAEEIEIPEGSNNVNESVDPENPSTAATETAIPAALTLEDTAGAEAVHQSLEATSDEPTAEITVDETVAALNEAETITEETPEHFSDAPVATSIESSAAEESAPEVTETEVLRTELFEPSSTEALDTAVEESDQPLTIQPEPVETTEAAQADANFAVPENVVLPEVPEPSPVSVEDAPDPIEVDPASASIPASKKLVPAMSESLFDVDFSEFGSVKQPLATDNTAFAKSAVDVSVLSSAELAALALSAESSDGTEVQQQSVAEEPIAHQPDSSAEPVTKSRKSVKLLGGDDDDIFDVDF